jgi:SPP1 gp7 family putative phage head morphogenesis protein
MAKNNSLGFAFNLPPEQAVNFLNSKISQESWSWTDVWEKAHEKTFTIAKTLNADVLEDLRSAVEDALANGTPFNEFQKNLEPILKSKGWWGSALTPDGEVVHLGTPWRLETIFRTNILSSYQAGRQNQMNEVLAKPNSRFKYKKYVAIRDLRTRPTHAQLNGKIFPADHDFWTTHTPPNGFNCRCDVVLVSQKEYERLGEPPVEDGKMKKAEVKLNKSGKTTSVSVYEDANGKLFPTDPGFSNSPNVKLKPDFDKYKPPVKQELKKAVAKKPKPPKKEEPIGWQPPKNFQELENRFKAFTLPDADFNIEQHLDFKMLTDSLEAVEYLKTKYPFLKPLKNLKTAKLGRGVQACANANTFKISSTEELWVRGKSEFIENEEFLKKWQEEYDYWDKMDRELDALRTHKNFYDLEPSQRSKIINDLNKVLTEKSKAKNKLEFNRFTYGISKEREAYATTIHEFGHIFHDQLIGGINDHLNKYFTNFSSSEKLNTSIAMKKKWKSIFTKHKRNAETKRIVSQYAYSDDKEFFAECFVIYEHNPTILPEGIKEFIDTMMKDDPKEWKIFLEKGTNK